MRTDLFNDALALSMRSSRSVRKAIERRTSGALHLVNLPAATDVKRLSEQVAALQRELRAVRRELDRRTGERG